MAEQEQNRSENASPHKLNEARKKGQVAKSQDVVSCLVFAVAMIVLYTHGYSAVKNLFISYSAYFIQAGSMNLSANTAGHYFSNIVVDSLSAVLPLFFAMMIAGIVGNVIQSGVMFSSHPITPDWERLNPISGFKKIFSPKTLYELIRNVIKAVVIGLIAYFSLRTYLTQVSMAQNLTLNDQLKNLFIHIGSFGIRMSVAFIVIALIDYVYVKKEFSNNMKMSKREVMEEIKQREGHPRIKSRMRELRNEMRKRATSLHKTKEADVLITNPTHIAVALKYSTDEMHAPQLVAKGAGSVAAVMRKIAAENNIMIVENKPLARELFKTTDNDQFIPVSLYPSVAKILVWINQRKITH